MGLVCEQSLYNLFVRDIELEVLPAAADYGLGVIAWSPLQGGLLGGILRKDRGGSRRLQERERSQDTLGRERARVEAYEELCESFGEEPAIVALAWLLRQPGVTAPIIGPRTVEQLNQRAAGAGGGPRPGYPLAPGGALPRSQDCPGGLRLVELAP